MKSFFRWLKRKFAGLFKRRTRRGSVKRYAVVIGMENSRKFGSCPGSRHDSLVMKRMLSPKTEVLRYFSDASATKSAVVETIKSVIDQVPEDGIFILTYSGHGGSQHFADTKSEADGKDEFLCLYDTYLKDDDIWDMVTHCKGRVFLFFDCCHSETMFRAPLIPPEDLLKEPEDDGMCGATARDSVINVSPVDMLVWSGCPDNTYSYGDNAGGLFTNALVKALDSGLISYKDIWSFIKKDKALSQYTQRPQQTVLGNFSTDAALWD